MKEKSRKVFEEYQTLFKHAVIDATENNHTVIPEPEISFTPGVPTEDGWYTCKAEMPSEFGNLDTYISLEVWHGLIDWTRWPEGTTILSHAKLPEL